MCLCDGTSGNENRRQERSWRRRRSISNQSLVVGAEIVYANKKRLVQEIECKGPTECVEGLGRN